MKRYYNQSSWIWLLLLSMLWTYPALAQQLALSTPQPQPETSIQPEGRTLSSVLEELEETYNVNFYYQVQDLENKYVDQKVRISKSANLSKTLKKILEEHALDCKEVQKNYYYVFKKNSAKVPEKVDQQRTTGNLYQENFSGITTLASIQGTISDQPYQIKEQTIRGRVTDADSQEPLPGVNVLAKGTVTGTVTDIDGNYQISVGDEVETLVFSSIGFKSLEVDINGRNVIDVMLAADIQSLEEVVVTALGITKEAKTLGYATSKVEPEEFNVNQIGRAHV